MKKLISIICCALALTLCLTACGQSAAVNVPQSLAKGGVLILSVNPEIAVEYDPSGIVTGVTARNDDALAIINSCTGLIGQPTREVVADLVTAIGDAGYFVEELEGQTRQITLEIEPGSSLPSDVFLDDVIADIHQVIDRYDWSAPLVVDGQSDFGLSDYADTDHGTIYDATDYGTDYDTTDYGTDYDATDYGTDYDATDYGTDYDTTDYDDTDYDDTDYDDTDYDDTDYDGATDYDSESDYDDSDYGDSSYQG